MRSTELLRWSPGRPVDIAAILRPLRRGPSDPAMRRDERGTWLAANTSSGPATLLLRMDQGAVGFQAWGPGADILRDGVPALLGAFDDDSAFIAHHPVVAEVRRRQPGLRLGATSRVWDVLLAAILEQKVTGTEAHRTWRQLAERYGTPAPGPAPSDMRVPPTPQAVLAIRDWDWHRAGLDGQRRRTVVAAAQVAHRLEDSARLRGAVGRDLLRKVPGIGVWTSAEVAQRVWGDPNAVSVGDYHIPHIVGHALIGRRLDDAGMLDALAPYEPQRQRAVRYIEAAGLGKPRYGPRFSPRDFRRI